MIERRAAPRSIRRQSCGIPLAVPAQSCSQPVACGARKARVRCPPDDPGSDWRTRLDEVLPIVGGTASRRASDELRATLDTILWRWRNSHDWTPRQLGVAVHAETVRIHPFVDGNGRTTRLLADLVFAAGQDPTEQQYDWDLDKTPYIGLLRAFDQHRDVTDLAAFVAVEQIEQPGA